MLARLRDALEPLVLTVGECRFAIDLLVDDDAGDEELTAADDAYQDAIGAFADAAVEYYLQGVTIDGDTTVDITAHFAQSDEDPWTAV